MPWSSEPARRGPWRLATWRGRGARVALVDGSHPREKPCGGGVTGRALAPGRRHARGRGRPVHRCRDLRGGRPRGRVWPLPGAELLRVFSRERFDAALLRQAIAAGATHIPSRVTSLVAGRRHAGRSRPAAPRSRRRGCWAPTGRPGSSGSRSSARSSGGSCRSPPGRTSMASTPARSSSVSSIGPTAISGRFRARATSPSAPARRRTRRRPPRCTRSPIAGSISIRLPAVALANAAAPLCVADPLARRQRRRCRTARRRRLDAARRRRGAGRSDHSRRDLLRAALRHARRRGARQRLTGARLRRCRPRRAARRAAPRRAAQGRLLPSALHLDC